MWYNIVMKKSVLFLLALWGGAASAAVSLAKPFSDGLVLQRERPVPVWGGAAPGEKVTVAFAGASVSATADAKGAWSVELPAMPASREGRTLTVTGGDGAPRTVRDVLVGEVWLCSGQSNMDMALADDTPRYGDGHGRMIAQVTHRPFVRYVTAPGTTGWHVLEPKFLFTGRKAALPVHWGLELYAQLEIPIGIVVAAVGASNIDSWNPANGPRANLHNTFLKDFVPYAIRGVIWYQGETNLMEGKLYTKKMHQLYDGWSALFRNPKMPFYYVQIAPYAYGIDRGVNRDDFFAPFVEAQAAFAQEEPRAAMTVINDIGDVRDIHPGNKWLVAKRLALHALKRDYGFPEVEDSSPVLAKATAQGNRVELTFAHAKALYVYNAERTLDAAFELAGADGVWKKARIVNFPKVVWTRFGNLADNKVVLVADGVANPVQVRHAWTKPWTGCLYNQVNLPTGTFRAPIPYSSDVK